MPAIERRHESELTVWPGGGTCPVTPHIVNYRLLCYSLMAVDDPNSVDIISIDPQGAIILTITDHLDWNDSKARQYSLQIKMNRYLAFIESGEILEHHPDARSRRIVIRVVTMSEPGADGTAFLERARNVIEQAGFGFQHRTFHADQRESGSLPET